MFFAFLYLEFEKRDYNFFVHAKYRKDEYYKIKISLLGKVEKYLSHSTKNSNFESYLIFL